MNPDQIFFLGPAGTFAHSAALAAQRRVGASCGLTASTSIVSVFEKVSLHPASLGVVPIENSAEGSVSFTLDALLEHQELRIVGEVVLDIEQCLLGEGSLSAVSTVVSHPHGLAQCKRWLHQNLPEAALIPSTSTAAAALQVRGQPEAAAIASELAGELAGLKVLVRGVHDRRENSTRFIVLGREVPGRTGHDKTSIVFQTPHERGALCRVLSVLDDAGLNLSRIQSRPMPGELWQYVFFADLEGHEEDEEVTRAFAAIRASGHQLRVFGSYPAAAKATILSGLS